MYVQECVDIAVQYGKGICIIRERALTKTTLRRQEPQDFVSKPYLFDPSSDANGK